MFLHKVEESIHIKNLFKSIQQIFYLSVVEHLMELKRLLNVVLDKKLLDLVQKLKNKKLILKIFFLKFYQKIY